MSVQDGAVVGGLYALTPGPGRPTPHGARHGATRLADGVPVELELLRPELAADPGVQARLAAGGDALRSLAGRHVVGVLHVLLPEQPGGVAALVRDRFPATVLADARRMEGGTVSPRQAVTTAVEVLSGLVEVHTAGLVHGALSERDVLLDTSVPLRTVVRVTGYGAAALLGRPVDVPLPPGAGPLPSPADDVFAAGLLLGQLLTGSDSPTPAVLRDAGIPAALLTALLPLLDADPSARPTAEEARASLAGVPGLDRLPALAPVQRVGPVPAPVPVLPAPSGLPMALPPPPGVAPGPARVDLPPAPGAVVASELPAPPPGSARLDLPAPPGSPRFDLPAPPPGSAPVDLPAPPSGSAPVDLPPPAGAAARPDLLPPSGAAARPDLPLPAGPTARIDLPPPPSAPVPSAAFPSAAPPPAALPPAAEDVPTRALCLDAPTAPRRDPAAALVPLPAAAAATASPTVAPDPAPVTLRPTGEAPPAAQGRRTRVLVGAGVVAVLALLAGLLAGGVFRSDDAPEALAPPAAPVQVAPYAFAPEARPDGLVVNRTWTLSLDGRSLHGATVVTNDTAEPVTAGVDEVVPKAVAEDVKALRFTPRPVVVRADPVVRFAVVELRPGGTQGWEFDVVLPTPVTTDSGLADLAAAAEKERAEYDRTRRRPPPVRLLRLALAPASLTLQVGEQAQLVVTGRLSDGRVARGAAIAGIGIRSSDPLVLQNRGDVVRGRAPGRTTVVARAGTVSAQALVVVLAPPAPVVVPPPLPAVVPTTAAPSPSGAPPTTAAPRPTPKPSPKPTVKATLKPAPRPSPKPSPRPTLTRPPSPRPTTAAPGPSPTRSPSPRPSSASPKPRPTF